MRHAYFIPVLFCFGANAAKLRGGKRESKIGQGVEIAGGNEDVQLADGSENDELDQALHALANGTPFHQQPPNLPSDERMLGIHDLPDGQESSKLLNHHNNSGDTAPEFGGTSDGRSLQQYPATSGGTNHNMQQYPATPGGRMLNHINNCGGCTQCHTCNS
eukprot:CAMPEP_0194324540 /NCGR_PEP_ID=MMETSP0171-20130528/28393_1 /TAXON_ID=218684 /ORGANISM="Corethron pennatum, Strain L29A3" /LENGTH=160 /DNA_ID=CAMNT_0039083465 /DNA_START=184 /DNA_END=662 /DNA_ORIENTATION=-